MAEQAGNRKAAVNKEGWTCVLCAGEDGTLLCCVELRCVVLLLVLGGCLFCVYCLGVLFKFNFFIFSVFRQWILWILCVCRSKLLVWTAADSETLSRFSAITTKHNCRRPDQTRPGQSKANCCSTAVSLQFSGRSKQNDSIEDGVGYTACWANFGLAVVVKWLSGYKTTQNAFSSSSTYLLSTSYSQFSKCPSFYWFKLHLCIKWKPQTVRRPDIQQLLSISTAVSGNGLTWN